MGILRSLVCLSLATWWMCAAQYIFAQSGTVTTDPSPPVASRSLVTYVQASVPASFSIDPTIQRQGNEIRVFLRGECLFLCPPNRIQTLRFTAPPLAAGTYVMTVYSGYPDAAGDALGTTVITVVAAAVPTVAPLSLLILCLLLVVIARKYRPPALQQR